MKTIIVNGRRITVPDAPTTPEAIADAAGVRRGRRIIRRTREGNYPLNPGQAISPEEGETFVDAPQRVKGR